MPHATKRKLAGRRVPPGRCPRTPATRSNSCSRVRTQRPRTCLFRTALEKISSLRGRGWRAKSEHTYSSLPTPSKFDVSLTKVCKAVYNMCKRLPPKMANCRVPADIASAHNPTTCWSRSSAGGVDCRQSFHLASEHLRTGDQQRTLSKSN